MENSGNLHFLPIIRNKDNGLCSKDSSEKPGIENVPVRRNILMVEPRTVRHDERMADLLYVLFRRSDL